MQKIEGGDGEVKYYRGKGGGDSDYNFVRDVGRGGGDGDYNFVCEVGRAEVIPE